MATPPSTENMKSFTVIYNILADGKTAKIAPTNAIIKADTVKLLVDLNCESSCQFKLASDTYPLVNGKTYTSSQTIEYILDKPGEWFLYNEYISGVRYAIAFK